MLRTIQTEATTMVTRVKTSPDLVPKALEPPTPPKAPASPPPLPRWIRIRQIRNRQISTISVLRIAVKMATAGVLRSGRDGARGNEMTVVGGGRDDPVGPSGLLRAGRHVLPGL